MPWFRTLLWIGTILVMIILGLKTRHLRNAGVDTVVDFEFADEAKAKEMLHSWEQAKVMHTVTSSIYVDYAFIVLYVLLMINCSNHQMNVEDSLVMNNLLRFNIPLALDTGILDVAENMIMMHNIRSMEDFFPTTIISIVKFVFAGWIIVVWLVAVVKKAVVTAATR